MPATLAQQLTIINIMILIYYSNENLTLASMWPDIRRAPMMIRMEPMTNRTTAKMIAL